MPTLEQLRNENCVPRKGAEHTTPRAEAEKLLAQLPGWALALDGNAIEKDFKFKDFYRTMAFVNAVAWIANAQDHHPDITSVWNRVDFRLTSHDVGGVTDRDVRLPETINELARH